MRHLHACEYNMLLLPLYRLGKRGFFFMTRRFNTMRKKCRKNITIYIYANKGIRWVRQVRFYVKPQLDKNIWGMTFSYSVRSTSNFCRRSNYTLLNRFFFNRYFNRSRFLCSHPLCVFGEFQYRRATISRPRTINEYLLRF